MGRVKTHCDKNCLIRLDILGRFSTILYKRDNFSLFRKGDKNNLPELSPQKEYRFPFKGLKLRQYLRQGKLTICLFKNRDGS